MLVSVPSVSGQPPEAPPAGWYPDPDSDSRLRYWTGNGWGPFAPEPDPEPEPPTESTPDAAADQSVVPQGSRGSTDVDEPTDPAPSRPRWFTPVRLILWGAVAVLAATALTLYLNGRDAPEREPLGDGFPTTETGPSFEMMGLDCPPKEPVEFGDDKTGRGAALTCDLMDYETETGQIATLVIGEHPHLLVQHLYRALYATAADYVAVGYIESEDLYWAARGARSSISLLADRTGGRECGQFEWIPGPNYDSYGDDETGSDIACS